MRRFDFVTVDVFTDRRFGGNQLAVFPHADGLTGAEMQALAAEMNYSETSFVLSPRDPGHDAWVRIFNRTAEMPFAGHPNVGTGYVLATLGAARGDVFRFEELAGLVEVRILRAADGTPTGAEIDAPQPFQRLGDLPVEPIASCIGLPANAVRIAAHPPVRATVGVEFVLVEVAQDALSGAAPDLAAFRRAQATLLPDAVRLSILLYARDEDRIRARMFAPLSGTWEDAATGSANAALAALLLSLGTVEELALEVAQGVEMGRQSRLRAAAWRTPQGIRAKVGGEVMAVLRGSAELDDARRDG